VVEYGYNRLDCLAGRGPLGMGVLGRCRLTCSLTATVSLCRHCCHSIVGWEHTARYAYFRIQQSCCINTKGLMMLLVSIYYISKLRFADNSYFLTLRPLANFLSTFSKCTSSCFSLLNDPDCLCISMAFSNISFASFSFDCFSYRMPSPL
jgi:hypothetical protein